MATTRAGQATATATSRAWAAFALAVAVMLAGCGAGAKPDRPYAWLRAAPAPPQWPTLRIANGATLAYPSHWQRVRGDRGTATAALLDAHDHYQGYLNLTPREGDETLSGWASFRLDHNREEGDRAVRQLSAGTGLAFRGGHCSCVDDSYTAKLGANYIEIACLIVSAKGGAVVVGATPPARWKQISPLLERAVASAHAPA